MTLALSSMVQAPSLSKLIAFVVIAIGAVVVAGWMLGSPTMVRMLPGSVAMGLNTALALIAAGIWLLMRGSRSFAARRVRIGLALFLVILFYPCFTRAHPCHRSRH